MSKKPESRLQLRIRKKLEAEVGGFWFKLHTGPFQVAGIPDLIGCVAGYFFAFEVKKKAKDEPSAIQWEKIFAIREAGGAAFVITTAEEAIRYVRGAVLVALARTGERIPVDSSASRGGTVFRAKNRKDANLPARNRADRAKLRSHRMSPRR